MDSPANIGNVNNPNLSEAHQALQSFWPRVTEEIRKIGQVRVRNRKHIIIKLYTVVSMFLLFLDDNCSVNCCFFFSCLTTIC